MTALRSRARVILDAASKCDRAAMSSSSGGEGGLRGLVHRVRKTVLGGKFIRDDVGNDVLRRPVSETGFRMPSPG